MFHFFFFSYFEIKIFFSFQFNTEVVFFKHYFLATLASYVPAVATWTFSVSELTVGTKLIAS